MVTCLKYILTYLMILLIIIIISLFAHSETMIVSIEHSKTHSMYKYNNYIQQIIHYNLAISTLGRLILN